MILSTHNQRSTHYSGISSQMKKSRSLGAHGSAIIKYAIIRCRRLDLLPACLDAETWGDPLMLDSIFFSSMYLSDLGAISGQKTRSKKCTWVTFTLYRGIRFLNHMVIAHEKLNHDYMISSLMHFRVLLKCRAATLSWKLPR